MYRSCCSSISSEKLIPLKRQGPQGRSPSTNPPLSIYTRFRRTALFVVMFFNGERIVTSWDEKKATFCFFLFFLHIYIYINRYILYILIFFFLSTFKRIRFGHVETVSQTANLTHKVVDVLKFWIIQERRKPTISTVTPTLDRSFELLIFEQLSSRTANSQVLIHKLTRVLEKPFRCLTDGFRYIINNDSLRICPMFRLRLLQFKTYIYINELI